jgi:polar amino acid transport system substrate-binding protein
MTQRRTFFSISAMALGAVLWTSHSAAQTAPVRMLLATTPKYNDEMRVTDGALSATRPGHHAELLIQAGKRCNALVEFRFVPWLRALSEVKSGSADGAFSASYDADRTGYAFYPMTAGKPDSSRALKDYSYSFFTTRNSALTWNGEHAAATLPIAVERGASIIPRLVELGLSTVELADNAAMLRMIAADRVAAAAVITAQAEAILAESSILQQSLTKLEPPIQEKFGYVVLSRQFHAAHPNIAECFWTQIRDIKASPQHAELVRSYMAENK